LSGKRVGGDQQRRLAGDAYGRLPELLLLVGVAEPETQRPTIGERVIAVEVRCVVGGLLVVVEVDGEVESVPSEPQRARMGRAECGQRIEQAVELYTEIARRWCGL